MRGVFHVIAVPALPSDVRRSALAAWPVIGLERIVPGAVGTILVFAPAHMRCRKAIDLPRRGVITRRWCVTRSKLEVDATARRRRRAVIVAAVTTIAPVSVAPTIMPVPIAPAFAPVAAILPVAATIVPELRLLYDGSLLACCQIAGLSASGGSRGRAGHAEPQRQ